MTLFLFQVIFLWTLVARHLCNCLDINPDLMQHLPLPSLPPDFAAMPQISLSDSQKTQIADVFDLFDTDGSGMIEQKELEYAMVALGFHSKIAKSAKAHNDPTMSRLMEGDNAVTLEEFNTLMTGKIGGTDSRDKLLAIFAIMSRERPEEEGLAGAPGLITIQKLVAVCRDFKVSWPVEPHSLTEHYRTF